MKIAVQHCRVAVLGSGSWGTALAVLLARNGHAVKLWARDRVQVRSMADARCNARFLPGVVFPSSIELYADIALALEQVDGVLLAVPSHGFRATLALLPPHIKAKQHLAWATKGLEPGGGKLLHEVATEVLGGNAAMAVISGPTFAKEVAEGLPGAVTVAATSTDEACYWASCLHSANFRAYTSNDVIGVELGGAIKNVLAIAAGIADGLGFGANTRAALVTRGLAEMMRLGVALGGRKETFMGLAGLGDLVLTCTDNQSRNRRLGLCLAEGNSLTEALVMIGREVEGVFTAKEVMNRARALKVEMPIAEQVEQVLYYQRSPLDAVRALLEREQKAETL